MVGRLGRARAGGWPDYESGWRSRAQPRPWRVTNGEVLEAFPKELPLLPRETD